MNIDSDHINYLIWRYLQESGMARFCTPLHCPNSHVTLQFFNITPLLSTLNCHVLTLCLASCPLLGWSTPTGFQHSAFTFGQESSIVRSSVAQGVFAHPTPQLPSCLPTVVSSQINIRRLSSPSLPTTVVPTLLLFIYHFAHS